MWYDIMHVFFVTELYGITGCTRKPHEVNMLESLS